MVNNTIFRLFKNGSKTFFYSSLFFPKKIREKVFILYAFVRKADDMVDAIPQDKEGFYNLKREFEAAYSGEKSTDIIIQSFVDLAKQKGFEKEWIDAFLQSMEMDIIKTKYLTVGEFLEYIYGSASVIGLMMAKLLNLPKESYESAKMLGQSMQLINSIRDINVDLDLGRTYLASNELSAFDLKNLEYEHVMNRKKEFIAFMNFQIDRYLEWEKKAQEGYRFIPRRYLIPVKTASDMYKWTANTIKADPFIVYRRVIKPSKGFVIVNIIKNMFMSLFLLVLVTLYSSSFAGTSETVSILRNNIFKAVSDPALTQTLITDIQNDYSLDYKKYPPVILAYYSSLQMLKAKQTFNITDKVQYIKEAMPKMDLSIEKEPENLESRYLRYDLYRQLPQMFNVRTIAEKDLEKILSLLENRDYRYVGKNMQLSIINSILKTTIINDPQRRKLETLRSE